ncbi:MAG: hypothetical protein PVF73_10805 [Bacteroidales bacterium]|jgi:hypothetical protein
MKNSLIILLCILFSGILAAQQVFDENPGLSYEKAFADMNKRIFTSGELFKYKAYVVNTVTGDYKCCSRFLFFDILNQDNRQVLAWKSNTAKGVCNGSVILPDSLSTGFYWFRVYSNWMLNWPDRRIFSIPILIVSLTQRDNEKDKGMVVAVSAADTSENNPVSTFFPDPSLQIVPEIVPDKENYDRNEHVRMELLLPELLPLETAVASLSVTVQNPFLSLLFESGVNDDFLTFFELSDTPLSSSSGMTGSAYQTEKYRAADKRINGPVRFLKETRGTVLRGKLVRQADGEGLPGEDIFLAKFDSVTTYLHATTNTEGDFYFLIDSAYENELLIIQAMPDIGREAAVVLENTPVYQPVNPETKKVLDLTTEQGQYLEYVRNSAIVSRIYQDTEKESLITGTPGFSRSFFTPDYTVLPSDYEYLPNFREIAENILPGVRFREKKGSYELDIVIPEVMLNDTMPAGLFLNGIPFSNLKYLASFSTTDIKRIDVCNHFCMHGNLIYRGILSIFTYDLTIQPSSLSNPFLFYEHRIRKSVSDDVWKRKNKEIPWLDQCLYWNPNIVFEKESSVHIDFLTSSIAGNYIVRLKGITSTGRPFSKHIEFKVGANE